MSQRGKQWLASKSNNNSFSIHPAEGGNVGSLIGLGYIEKEIKQTETGPVETGKWKITDKGYEWIKHQGRSK